MQLSYSNDVRIYNLSAGKSLPEWISDRKRRKLEQKDIDVRRRIQLIQDFDMPDVSHTVNVTPNGRYVFATGTYKPFVKCYDLNDISLKFARGLDADVIKMINLSDDYSKFVLLEEDRYLEMHAAYGRYFRLRIPRFGRDMAFCKEASDLMIVASGNEIYRLNLEQGQFLEPFVSSAPSLTCCEISDYHQLFVCGTIDGRLEAWDHRDRKQVGVLDCVADAAIEGYNVVSGDIPQTTAVKFKDALHLAVGMSTGKILLYDIRSNRPLLVKDHQMGLPIKAIDFVTDRDLVLGMDSRVLKIWNEENGKPFAAIEPGTTLLDLCRYPESGLLFMANEAPKILQYFVPGIGTAPKWCSYLETITEELEETEQPSVYDDYKFVTAKELEDLDLDPAVLKKMNMLRAYMHGYFIDARLYSKYKLVKQQFDLESYRNKKLMERVEAERANPISLKKVKEEKLPKVNKELAAKLRAEMSLLQIKPDRKLKKKGHEASTVLSDERFKDLFTNPDFQVDETTEQYKLTQQAVQKLEEKKKHLKQKSDVSDEEGDSDNEDFPQSGLFMEEPKIDEEESSEEGSSKSSSSETGSDDEEPGTSEEEEDVSDEGRGKNEEKKERESAFKVKERQARKPKSFELIELDTGEDAAQFVKLSETSGKAEPETLGTMRERIGNDGADIEQSGSFGNRQMTFVLKAQGAEARAGKLAKKQLEHLQERKELRRGARKIERTLKRLPVRGGFRGRRRGS